jgi:signal recognition particle receptor subunit beta
VDYGGSRPLLTSAKIVVAGGRRVGRTTFVTSIADTDVMSFAALPAEGVGVTGLFSTEFGRVTLDRDLMLYLFSPPQQRGPHHEWDDVLDGAIGGVVLLDVTRPADSIDAIAFFEECDLPYVVALNSFDGAGHEQASAVLEAMAVASRAPIVKCDPRDRGFIKRTLITLVEHAKIRRSGVERPAV